MKLKQRLRDESIVFMFLPAIIIVMSSIMGSAFYETILILIPVTAGFFLYVVIRWAFFDKTHTLGKTAYGMWRRSYNN